ncbi:MAG: hypothetical protein ACE5FW_02555 [Candidatus Aenigmatarchaeota archaeon]
MADFKCGYCGKDLAEYGGGAYASSLKQVYCPRGPGLDNHCIEMGMMKRKHTDIVIANFKTIGELRKIRKQGGLSD